MKRNGTRFFFPFLCYLLLAVLAACGNTPAAGNANTSGQTPVSGQGQHTPGQSTPATGGE